MKRALIVDADHEASAAISSRLLDKGFTVDVIRSGREVEDRLSGDLTDLVFLDVTLPGIPADRGSEFVSRFKDTWPSAKIVAMTYRNSRTLERDVRRQGILYYMVKPVNVNELEELLSFLCRNL